MFQYRIIAFTEQLVGDSAGKACTIFKYPKEVLYGCIGEYLSST